MESGTGTHRYDVSNIHAVNISEGRNQPSPAGTLSATYAGAASTREQYIYPDEEKEKALVLRPDAVVGGQMMQIQCALLPSQHFEYVRGSHNRWDTPEELLVRKGGRARENRFSDDMPGAECELLMPGDALVFCPWVIHRGHCECRGRDTCCQGCCMGSPLTRDDVIFARLLALSDLVDEPRCSLMFTYSNGPRPTCKSSLEP